MAIVEIDTLQRVRDMTETFDVNGNPVTTQFRPDRIEAVTISDSSYLFMTGENGGFAVAEIGSNGSLEFDASFGGQFNALDGRVFGAFGISTFESGGKTHLYLTGGNSDLQSIPDNFQGTGISTFRINDEGEANYLRGVGIPGLSGLGGTDPQIATVAGTDMLFVAVESRGGIGEPAFQSYRIRDNGTLQFLRERATVEPDNDDFAVLQVGNKTFIVASSPFNTNLSDPVASTPVQVLQVGSRGAMAPVFELRGTSSEIFNQNIIDTHGVQVGDRAFVYMANNTGGNILGYEVLSDGRLELVENERPLIGDDWTFPAELASFEQGGRTYLVAGANALAVFEISDGGALTEVDEIPETFRSRVVGAQDLDVLDIEGEQFIFASTGNLDEVRSYRFVQEDDRVIFGSRDNNRRTTDEDEQIFAQNGDDTIRADGGDDVVEGGNGNDLIFGMDGNDNLFGNDGDDELLGGDGFDFLFGGEGRDDLRGGFSNDVLDGGIGKDRLFGDGGSDVLRGGVGNDQLRGGTGSDRLIDGNGSDRLFGEANADVFELERDGKLDVIRDYEDNLDIIDLTRWGEGLEFSDLTITQDGNDVLITWDDEVTEVRAADGQIFAFELSLSDFVFA